MRRMGFAVVMLLSAAVAGCAGAPEPLEVTVQMTEFAFTPATIEVQVGQPVVITLTNVGSVLHDLHVLDVSLEREPVVTGGVVESGEQDEGTVSAVHAAVDPGQTATVEFVPAAPGTYEIICDEPGHKEAGMVGTLIVR